LADRAAAALSDREILARGSGTRVGGHEEGCAGPIARWPAVWISPGLGLAAASGVRRESQVGAAALAARGAGAAGPPPMAQRAAPDNAPVGTPYAGFGTFVPIRGWREAEGLALAGTGTDAEVDDLRMAVPTDVP